MERAMKSKHKDAEETASPTSFAAGLPMAHHDVMMSHLQAGKRRGSAQALRDEGGFD